MSPPPQVTPDEPLARLLRIVNRLPLLVASYDRARRFTFANRLYAERIGTTPERLIGRTIDDVFGPEVTAAIEPHIQRVLTGEDAEFEMSVHFAGVGKQHVRGVYLAQRDEHGCVIGWDAVLRIITQERRAANDMQNLATLVENANDFIGWCDLDLHPVYVNRFGLTMLGTTLEEVSRVTIMDFFFPEDVPMIRDEFIPLVERDGFAAVEVRFRHFRYIGLQPVE